MLRKCVGRKLPGIFNFFSAIYIQQSPSTTLEIQAVNSFTVTSSWKTFFYPTPFFCSIFFSFFFIFSISYCVCVCMQASMNRRYPHPTLIGFLSNLHFFSSTLFFLSHKWLFSFMTLSFFPSYSFCVRKKILIIKNSAGEGLSFHSFVFNTWRVET